MSSEGWFCLIAGIYFFGVVLVHAVSLFWMLKNRPYLKNKSIEDTMYSLNHESGDNWGFMKVFAWLWPLWPGLLVMGAAAAIMYGLTQGTLWLIIKVANR
jgi:hypothetical protein